MQYQIPLKTKCSISPRCLTTGVIFVISILVFIFSSSKTVNAGLVSFISSIIGGEQASAEIRSVGGSSTNSQTISLLTAAANHDPNPEKPSDIVPIGSGAVLVPDLAIQNSTSTDTSNMQISTYIVRDGDTISGVAKMFNVSINTILWANDLSGKSVLRAGQTLVILPISGISHTVKKGDTLKGIANKYKSDIEDIINYNDITMSSTLSVGNTIIIPNAEMSSISSPSNSSSGRLLKAPYEPLLDGWDWPSYPGYYIKPISGGVKTQKLHGHNGVDFAAPVGTPLYAAAAGTVIINKMNGAYNGGYGNYVVVSHPNGTQTLYAHMQKSAISNGDQVSQGQTIGYIGMTGMTTGPHVHFEIRGAKNPF